MSNIAKLYAKALISQWKSSGPVQCDYVLTLDGSEREQDQECLEEIGLDSDQCFDLTLTLDAYVTCGSEATYDHPREYPEVEFRVIKAKYAIHPDFETKYVLSEEENEVTKSLTEYLENYRFDDVQSHLLEYVDQKWNPEPEEEDLYRGDR